MLVLKLLVEKEEQINFYFYWWILIALKKPVQFFPKLESFSTELPRKFWQRVCALFHLSTDLIAQFTLCIDRKHLGKEV